MTNPDLHLLLFHFLCPVPDLIDLEDELQDVITWIPFGLYLGIKIGKLRAIERECSTVQECRIKMLEEWQNNVTPTWSAVVKALVGIGMRRNASELAEKHGWLDSIMIHTIL